MKLASLTLFAAVLAVALATRAALGSEDDGQIEVIEVEPVDRGSSNGIFGFLLKPFKATFDHAKKLLGSSTGDARDLLRDGFDEIHVRAFKLFMSAYNKTYDSPAELRRRMKIFFERRKMIQQSVMDFSEGRIPFAMKENTFTDWDDSELKVLHSAEPPQNYHEMTDDEREALISGSNWRDDAESEEPETDSEPTVESIRYGYDSMGYDTEDLDEGNMTVMAPDGIPASKDWRESGCVATPMDQRKCGACYAIATTNTLETMRCINKVSSPILSPQQVVDCSTPRAGYQNHGCDGGWPTRVLKYLQDVRVITRESCYPFAWRQQACQLRKVQATKSCTLSSSPTGTTLRYKILDNERDILHHVAKTGPVITVMQARDSFLFYSKGIYDDPKCSRRRNDVDHAIAIVGYGRENGMNYWLIKNSWGTTEWGEGGFGKYRRGARTCSIGSWGWVITS